MIKGWYRIYNQPNHFFFWLLFCCWHIHCTHISIANFCCCIVYFFGRVEFEVWEKGCSNFRIIGTKKFYLWLNMLRATRKHTFFFDIWIMDYFKKKKLEYQKPKIYLKIIQKKKINIKITKPNTFGHPCDYCCYYYIFFKQTSFQLIVCNFYFYLFFFSCLINWRH